MCHATNVSKIVKLAHIAIISGSCEHGFSIRKRIHLVLEGVDLVLILHNVPVASCLHQVQDGLLELKHCCG